jgi:NADH:ubiquinone oxidoreductase subunit 6 (subunit J)
VVVVVLQHVSLGQAQLLLGHTVVSLAGFFAHPQFEFVQVVRLEQMAAVVVLVVVVKTSKHHWCCVPIPAPALVSCLMVPKTRWQP